MVPQSGQVSTGSRVSPVACKAVVSPFGASSCLILPPPSACPWELRARPALQPRRCHSWSRVEGIGQLGAEWHVLAPRRRPDEPAGLMRGRGLSPSTLSLELPRCPIFSAAECEFPRMTLRSCEDLPLLCILALPTQQIFISRHSGEFQAGNNRLAAPHLARSRVSFLLMAAQLSLIGRPNLSGWNRLFVF